MVSTNFSKVSVNSTGFSKPTQVSTGFGIKDTNTDVLLLQNGTDSLLLQNGTDELLLGGNGELESTNYSRIFA